jgi:hypothetical protein
MWFKESMLPSEIWTQILQSEWWNRLLEVRTLALAATVVLLLALAWYAGMQQKRRRAHAMLVAVNDATFGRCIPRSRIGAWGFAVGVEPPPERFREFNISYQPVSIFDPVDLLRICFGGHKATLQISGVLLDAPTAEIIWLRGQPPARTLGVNPGRSPWVQSRIDYARAEYATRGTNVATIKHIFRDMYTRFMPILLTITVQRERRPQLRVVAQGRIEARDVSPLITSVRSLGRAAMMK